jgi:hypothetical protein
LRATSYISWFGITVYELAAQAPEFVDKNMEI